MTLLIKYLYLIIALAAGPAVAQEKLNIFIATGPTAGVYYPMGGGLADLLTKHVPTLNATAGTTAGSIANLQLMQNKKADIAFSMADASWDAYKGQQKFAAGAVPLRASAISAARGATVLDPLRLSFYSLAALQPATAPIKTMPATPMGIGRERCRPETCSSMKCSGPACG